MWVAMFRTCLAKEWLYYFANAKDNRQNLWPMVGTAYLTAPLVIGLGWKENLR